MSNYGIIPVTVEYRSSLQKWKGIREFVEVNDLGGIDEIDAMIAHIEDKGDAVLPGDYTLEMLVVGDYLDAMYSEDDTPCPHCVTYGVCRSCPLSNNSMVMGGLCTCCPEWKRSVWAAQVAIDKQFLER